MQVKHRLATILARIDGHSVASPRNAKFRGDLSCDQKHMAKKFFVLRLDFCQRSNLFLGYNQNVSRGLWANIMKDEAMFVFVNNFSRYFAIDDLLKYRFFDWRHMAFSLA